MSLEYDSYLKTHRACVSNEHSVVTVSDIFKVKRYFEKIFIDHKIPDEPEPKILKLFKENDIKLQYPPRAPRRYK